MKKAFIGLMSLVFLGAGVGIAASEESGTARYGELKALKTEQRAKREERRHNPQGEEKKGPTFWDREAERSGLGQSQAPLIKMMKGLNPVPFLKKQQENYNARKVAAPTAK